MNSPVSPLRRVATARGIRSLASRFALLLLATTALGQDGVAGLYSGTKYGLTLNPLSNVPGSGTWGVQVEHFLLSRDGQVFRARTPDTVPGADLAGFDFEAARRRQPSDCGTYTVRGQEILITVGAPRVTLVATRAGPNEFELAKVKYTRILTYEAAGRPPAGAATNPAPAVTSVVTAPPAAGAAAAPGAITGLPTLVYEAPAGFTEPSGSGFHEAKPYWHSTVAVYDFRRFSGKDFAAEFRATRFRDWLAEEHRENRLSGEVEFGTTGTLAGADQLITAVFAEEFEGPRIGPGDRRTPRLRIRIAALAAGAVAIADVMVRDADAYQKHGASLKGFMDSLKILPAPPPLARAEVMSIAGVWEWDGNPVPTTPPIAFLHAARARMECYVFAADGRVAWRGKPSGDIRNLDFEAARKVSTASVGTFFKRGSQLVLRFGDAPYYVYHAEIKGTDTLEILGYTYRRTQRAGR